MDFNFSEPSSQIPQESAVANTEAEHGWAIPEEISSSRSQSSQHSQQLRISLSTEEEHEDEGCEEDEQEHDVKRRRKSKVWDHFTHPAKVKGMLRSTCNHCRYVFSHLLCSSTHVFCFLTLALQNVIGDGQKFYNKRAQESFKSKAYYDLC
jgi:hypothetical protein